MVNREKIWFGEIEKEYVGEGFKARRIEKKTGLHGEKT